MAGKRSYILKNQRIIYGHDNVGKMCCCIFLILLVISVIIGLTAYFVKNAQSNSEEKHDGINYHDVGNNEMLKTNKKVTQHPNVRNDYLSTTVDGRNDVIATSNIAEFTSTSIESPLSTSTMSPNDVPTRFLFVNTIGYSSSDYVEADSTNEYARSTPESGNDATPFLRDSTETDFVSDSPITLDDGDIVFQLKTKSENDESFPVKRSTERYFVSDVPLTTDDNIVFHFTTKSKNDVSSTERNFVSDEPAIQDDNFIDEYQWTNMDEFTDTNTTPEFQSDDRTCKTDMCKQSAGRMLAFMNHTANPCGDFYSFACGGFDINHFKEFTVKDSVSETLSDMSSLDLTVTHKKLYHDFYVSCVNYKTGRGFKEVGKFLYDFCKSHRKLTDLIADILMMHPQKKFTRLLPLFDVVVEVGPDKTFVPTVSLPKLDSLLAESDERDFYERSCQYTIELETIDKNDKSTIQQSYEECLTNQTEYFERLKDAIELFQIFEHLSPYKKQQNIMETLQFIELNIIGTFGSISPDDLNNDKYVTVALNWLTTTYPQIEWKKLFEKLFGQEVAKDITEVRLTHYKYLVKIFEFYNSYSLEEVKISLLSMMAHDMYIYFVEPFSPNDRKKYCMNLGMKLMPDIASKLYLEKFNSTEVLYAEKKLKLMFQQLILTFSTTLNKNNTWLSPNERREMSNKVSELNLVCNPYGFFNFDKNYKNLYAGVKISQDDYISNVFALKKVVRRRMYNTYGLSVLSPDVIWNYLVWPISTTPFRIEETNSIVMPTSLIETFRHESQKIEEFSTVGFSIAQEIAHFLFTNETSSLFVEKNVNFKGNVEIHLQDPGYSKKPNIFGIKLSEKEIQASKHSRFIDDVALRVTFDAYNQFQSSFDQSLPWTDYSTSNIFYILVSQSFCIAKTSSAEVAINLIQNEDLPNYFRVNSMMVNSEDFLNTFECQNGS